MTPAAWTWIPEWWFPNLQTLIGQLQEPSFDGWLLARYAVQALLTSAPIWLADYVLGLALLKLLGVRLNGGLKQAAALAMGAGTAALGIFFFGVLGRLTGKGLLAFTIIQALIGLWFARSELRLPRWRWAYLWALPLLLLYLPDLMMPVLEYDSNMYHMASARWYMQQQKIVYHEGIRFNAQPHLPVMLYMRQWWLTQDANLIKLVNMEYLAMLVCLFHWFARRNRVRWGMLVALGLTFGSPIFGYIVRQEYADFALAAWLSVGVAVMLAGGDRWRRGRLVAAGLLMGFAASSKLQGLAVVSCFLGADFAAFAWRRRSMWLALSRSTIMGAGVIITSAGWWMRSWRHTGSPVAPFLTDSPDVKALFQVNAGYGVGRDLVALLATPWNMIVVPPEKYADLFRFGPSCLILLAVGLTSVLWRRKALDYATVVVILGSALFTLLWFGSGQVMRYEACLLPLWSLLLLGAMRRVQWPRWGIAIVFVPLLLSTSLLTSNVIRYGVPPPVTWPATQGVLNAVLPYYRPMQAASRLVGKNDRVYTWFCDDIRFYAPGKAYGDWFGGYTYTWLGNVHSGPKIPDAAGMIARLKQEGFRFIIVDRQRSAHGASIYGTALLNTGIVKPHLEVPGTEIVFDDGNYVVFRLT